MPHPTTDADDASVERLSPEMRETLHRLLEDAVHHARATAHDSGYRSGWRAGFRLGLACAACAGVVVWLSL